ncbi:MAG: hypothetical protein IRZ03_13120 [Acidobacterium ailaaui]|nr:hypothetical protein [Pseudacidobacterium ailaaui]
MRVPLHYVTTIVIALLVTLLLAFANFDSREYRYRSALRNASHSEAVTQSILRFGLDGEHPLFTRADWMRSIAAGETQDSYWQWATKQDLFVTRVMKAIGLEPTDRPQQPRRSTPVRPMPPRP